MKTIKTFVRRDPITSLIIMVVVAGLLVWFVPAWGQTQHSVVLTWVQSTSPVATNSVWRGPGACPQAAFTKIFTSTSPVTTYTDTNVTSGQSYCYYVTASDSSGNQSSPSNTVSGTVPGPVPPTGLTATAN
jgi:hypothetical protein